MAAAGGGAALMLLAIVLYIHTNRGLVKIEISDPNAKVEVKVDGETIQIAAVPDLLTLRVGDHAIQVVSDQFATVTQSFTVRCGALEVVRVTLEPKGEGQKGTEAQRHKGTEGSVAASPGATAGSSSSAAGINGGQAVGGTQPLAPPLAIAPFDAAQAKQHQEAWAKYLGVPVETTNAVGMALVLIPPGEFVMGDGDDAHKVCITKPFYLGKYEVTQAEWERVMGRNPSYFKGAQNPVEQVRWEDCPIFLKRLGEKCDEPDGRYRLPSEAVGVCVPVGNHGQMVLWRRRGETRGLRLVQGQLGGEDASGGERRSRTPGGCTTCMGMWMNGVRTGLTRTTTRRLH